MQDKCALKLIDKEILPTEFDHNELMPKMTEKNDSGFSRVLTARHIASFHLNLTLCLFTLFTSRRLCISESVIY